MKPITARVWPHNHTSAFGGPLDVKIGITSQPELLRGWNPKKQPLFNIEQPHRDETNFTVLRVLFLKFGTNPTYRRDEVWHKAGVWGLQELPIPPDSDPGWNAQDDDELKESKAAWKKLKPSHLTVYLKARYTDALPHPVPLGKWEGTVVEDERRSDGKSRWVLYTLQAVTLAVQKVEEKRHILLPGDPEYVATQHYSRVVPNHDEVA